MKIEIDEGGNLNIVHTPWIWRLGAALLFVAGVLAMFFGPGTTTVTCDREFCEVRKTSLGKESVDRFPARGLIRAETVVERSGDGETVYRTFLVHEGGRELVSHRKDHGAILQRLTENYLAGERDTIRMSESQVAVSIAAFLFSTGAGLALLLFRGISTRLFITPDGGGLYRRGMGFRTTRIFSTAGAMAVCERRSYTESAAYRISLRLADGQVRPLTQGYIYSDLDNARERADELNAYLARIGEQEPSDPPPAP